ncbi:Chaperonin 10 [Giardia muris]|uniref:Chaperonin 10 n=1 Tax=Giardia muris TaxID=5742 RepID=A0A4Z1SNK1_GIAMU|nr:Chaperonin 10 [Giardia muris]|eukprot:TNJ26455.1 Chaperonin 10 [Giardia muris]
MPIVLGPRLFLEAVTAPATQTLYAHAPSVREYVVRLVGTGVSPNLQLRPGAKVVVPAKTGLHLRLDGHQGVLVDETDVLVRY